MTEALENRRKRLIFRSWHRGTREMDLIMGSFADAHVPGFDADQCATYEALLETPDPDLYDWYTGQSESSLGSPVLDLFLRHKVVNL